MFPFLTFFHWEEPYFGALPHKSLHGPHEKMSHWLLTSKILLVKTFQTHSLKTVPPLLKPGHESIVQLRNHLVSLSGVLLVELLGLPLASDHDACV